MAGYKVDAGVPFLSDDTGKVVGYIADDGKEYALDGSLLDRDKLDPIARINERVARSVKNYFSLPDNVETLANNTEQILAQCKIPSSDLKDRSRLDLLVIASKIGGTSDTATFRIRVGKLGTTADPILVSAALAGSTITLAYRTGVQIFSDGFRQLGLNTAVVPTPGASTSALASKQTISDFLLSDVYVSVCCVMTSGAVEKGNLSAFDVDVRY